MRASSLLVARPTAQPYLIFVTYITYMRYVEKNLSCGEILDLYAQPTDIEKSEISPHVNFFSKYLHM